MLVTEKEKNAMRDTEEVSCVWYLINVSNGAGYLGYLAFLGWGGPTDARYCPGRACETISLPPTTSVLSEVLRMRSEVSSQRIHGLYINRYYTVLRENTCQR